MYYKIKWYFINKKTAHKAVDLLGAKSIDCLKFYKNNKLLDELSFSHFSDFEANKRAKKEITKFFKQNQSINDFVEFYKL